MRRSDRFHLNKVVGATLAVMVGVVAFFELVGPVGTDARDRIGQETDSGTVVLEAEALDTAYAQPTPAPSEPAWRDSFSVCRVRLCQHLEDCQWREPMGVGR